MIRKLSGTVRIKGTDHEAVASNEHVDRTTKVSLVIGSEAPEVPLVILDLGWGGECRVEVRPLTAKLLSNGVIVISGQARLYEGTKESTSHLKDTESFTFPVPRNTAINTNAACYVAQLINTERHGGDHAEIMFDLSNHILEEN